MIPSLPTAPGAYRWLYADLTDGDLSAVVIFMVGSVFSPRYSTSWRRGARPLEHCAVNLAVYERGARWLWVLTEYPTGVLTRDELRIGQSTLRFHPDGRLELDVVDRTAPWGRRVHAHLVVTPQSSPLAEQTLVDGLPHFWQPLAPRAEGRLEVESLGLKMKGSAYVDTNHGTEPLGASLPGWTWLRIHEKDATHVGYWPRTRTGPAPALWVRASPEQSTVQRVLPATPHPLRTAWRLPIPAALGIGSAQLSAAPRLLESSPFYARLEAHTGHAHGLAEVADFARFHRADLRWMAHFRTRRASA